MRIAKAFEIEKNYQRHLDRLHSINSSNLKKKVNLSTAYNVKLINNYKKQKLTADIFSEREKHQNMTTTNFNIHKNLFSIMNRNTQSKNSLSNSKRNQSLNRINSKTSLRSYSSNESRIREENLRMTKRLIETKSSYNKMKQRNHSFKNTGASKKEEVAKLLQVGLGRKPKVFFPSLPQNKPKPRKGNRSSFQR